MLCALIMAGGKGTRFWPLSTEEKPKQFLNLVDDRSMIQMTVDRIRDIIPLERIFVCTGKKYVNLVREQVPDILERNIIVEPEGRNTAPCIALSSLVINRYYPNSNMVVLPSDHLIKEEEMFRKVLLKIEEFISSKKEALVMLGMMPTRPEVGYGYIKCSEKFNIYINRKILKVDKFVEKPSKEVAEEYLKNGMYLWNGGMFLWNIDTILNQIKTYLPDTYEAIRGIEDVEEDKLQEFIDNNYGKTDSISIDYGILERTKDIYVIPCEFGWDDIGTWSSVERYKKKDGNNNIIEGNIKVIDSTSNIALNGDRRIVMIGIKDVMTLDTNDTIYIVNKKYMSSLKNYKDII